MSYDTSGITNELQKELDSGNSNLKAEVENLIKKFRAYESEVKKYEALNAAAELEISRLVSGVNALTKAVDMITDILHSDAGPENIVKLLKSSVKR